MPKPAKRVAVIGGGGPAGAIAIDALVQEQAFDLIRVFERREAAGGCWLGDTEERPPNVSDLAQLADRSADAPLSIPKNLPASTPKSSQPRFTESSIYPYLETNVDAVTMEFTREPIPVTRSARGLSMHGPNTPFRPWTAIRGYITDLLSRNGYGDLISYQTTVERAEKAGDEWVLTLRKDGEKADYWWTETFDAVVVCTGHFSVPYIPTVEGLKDFEKSRPGSVLHSKSFRGRDHFANKTVVVVGGSVSAMDIASDIVDTASTPVHTVSIGHTNNPYFGDIAFRHRNIRQHHAIDRIQGRTVHFADGSSVPDVDHIIFGTGYSWTLPFLPGVPVRNNRVPDLYQHIVWRHDPSLLFIGATGTGLTFKIFEWQAVYAARLLAGRGTLPSAEEMEKWEVDRIAAVGDGPKFIAVFPHFEEYFNKVRALAGEGVPGVGRKLPKFDPNWQRLFLAGAAIRKERWQRLNAEADAKAKAAEVRPKL